MSEEHRLKLSEARRQYWERRRAEGKEAARADDPRRQPRSPEVRRRISETRKATLERLGGWPDEWRENASAAAAARRWSPAVRYRMSRSHAGKLTSPETLAKMAAGQQRRRQRERTARGEDAVGGPAAGLPAAPPAPQLNEALARERAVIELSRLRQEVFAWMRAFEEQHGRKPTLPETADINPPIYQKFVRFMALRDALRASDIKA